MKLYCTAALKQETGWKCPKAPTPPDPLDSWYAGLANLRGVDIVVAAIPAFHFCVLLRDALETDWDDFNHQLVQSIRAALYNPAYSIPLSVLDRYLPEDTVFEPCSSVDRGFTAQMGSTMRKVQNGSYRTFWMYVNDSEPDPPRMLLAVNDTLYFPTGSEYGKTPWREMKAQLQRRYGKAAPAMELEVSLDTGQYEARRTLIVSAETSLYYLSAYLHAAYRWSYDGIRQFILPPVQIGTYPAHGKDTPEVLPLLPGGAWLWDRGPRLCDLLREGAVFQYRYQAEGTDAPRTVQVQVHRCIPDCTEEIPICTVCQGESPPEWASSDITQQIHLDISIASGDPRQKLLRDTEGRWLQEDTPESLTARLDAAVQWLLPTVEP